MLVQSSGKLFCAIWNLVTKTCPKLCVTFIFQNFKKLKKNEKIHMDSEK